MYHQFTFILLLFATSIHAQITGDWEVTSVQVGEESMTPVAKWFSFQKDGTYTGGNGWLQNDAGQYTFDNKANTLTLLGDEYGPFTLQKTDSDLQMQRTEEGMNVTVQLVPMTKKPKAPWDQLVGNWSLTKAPDDFPFQSIFMRWDRLLVAQKKDEARHYAYWYVHPHRSELRLLNDGGDIANSYWDFTFEGNTMTWQERGGRGRTVVWERVE